MFSKIKAPLMLGGIVIVLALIYEVKGGTETCPAGQYKVAEWKEGDSQPRCKECPEGTYSSVESNATYCEDCRERCPLGTVLKNTCSATTDNRCDCKYGYYWKDNDAYDGKCLKHRTCKENEVVIKEGTPTEDTVCGPKPTGPTSTGADKDSNGKAHSGSDRSFKATGQYVLRQYGHVAVIVIISIASVYVLFQYRL